MNTFLNENWAEIRKEVLPAILEVVKKITYEVCNGFASSVPFDIIYPE